MIRFATLFFLLLTQAAWGQSVQQSGKVTPGHVPMWTTNGIIQDGGTAAAGFLTSLGVTAQGPGICQNSGLITGPYQQVCINVNLGSASYISLQNYGGASPQPFEFIINGVVYTFGNIPPVPGIPKQRSITSTSSLPVVASDQILNINVSTPITIALPLAATRAGLALSFNVMPTSQRALAAASGSDTINGVATFPVAGNAYNEFVPYNDGVNSGWSVH